MRHCLMNGGYNLRKDEFFDRAVRAELPVYGGYVIGRQGKTIFIKGAIPGEMVEIEPEQEKKDYYTASVKNVTEPSPARRQSPCRLFGVCGGCHLQFIDYDRQVLMKEEILLDAIRRIAGIEVSLEPSIRGNEFGYRHRAQFKVSDKGHIGFFREGTREVVPVERCMLMNDQINRCLQVLGNMNLKGIKEIHAISGDAVALLIKGKAGEGIIGDIIGGGIAGVALENGDSQGRDYIMLDLNGLQYTITPWSFFQTNWALNREVVDIVKTGLSPLENKYILDIYAGAGNFSMPLSLGAKEVIAVEENSFAVEDGRRNISLNRIKNCSFLYLGDDKRQGAGRKAFNGRAYDAVVLNPPRIGLTQEFMKKIMGLLPGRIAYLSCNPATLARDLKRFVERYDVESVRMVDFFPNTYHIETLVFLNRK